MSRLWQESGIFRTDEGQSGRGYDRMVSCSGKIEFRNKKAAIISIREHDQVARQRAYKCRHCPHWHVGRFS
jgi:hypothetical protein